MPLTQGLCYLQEADRGLRITQPKVDPQQRSDPKH